MVENTPTPPTPTEQPCELCKDPIAVTMAAYAATSIGCHAMADDNTKKSCLALIVPLEKGDQNADPVEILADVMLLDQGVSIDKFAEIASDLIERAAARAAEKANKVPT